MRNYIILNGQNSQDIQGLLIQSLAPITKPLMRTEIEEIDGRDGDIVTKLGFSAYDKEITIGLYGTFDIDEIIAYFNSEGIVTFSNEPDKYYNYQILDEIDFERLVRYRTATVTMHCQPFKYSTEEGAKIFTSSLLSVPDFTQTQNGVTVKATNGVISFSGTATAGTEFYVPVNALTLSAGGYVLNAMTSGTNASQAALRLIYNSPSNANSFGGKYVTLANNGTVSISANLTASKTYNYLYFYVNTGQAMDFTLSVSVENAIADEGSSLVLENTPEGLFDKLDLKGNAIQSGTPTPDSPVDVQVVTGGNTVKVVGKNLLTLDGAFERKYPANLEFTQTSNSVGITANTTTGSQYVRFQTSELDSTQTYNLSFKAKKIVKGTAGHPSITVLVYGSNDGTNLTSLGGSGSSNDNPTQGVEYSFSRTLRGYKFYYITFYNNASTPVSSGEQTEYYDIQLELGSQASDYQAYQGQEFPIGLGSIELAKIPNTDYEDKPVKVGDTWYIRRMVGKATVSLGTTVYTLSGGFKGATYAPAGKINGSGGALCDKATRRPDGVANWDGCFYENPANFMFVGSADDTATTLKAKYDGATLYYALATPVDEEITDETLISQLEALKQAHAYEGRTHVMAIAESGNAPHIIEAGISTASNVATVINEGNIYSRPTLTIYGFGDITISLNGNQIFNISLGSEGYITIDTNAMDAYQGTIDNLKNRLVDGDYSNFKLKTGTNTLSWSGDVSKIVIENYSRWL